MGFNLKEVVGKLYCAVLKSYCTVSKPHMLYQTAQVLLSFVPLKSSMILGNLFDRMVPQFLKAKINRKYD